MNALQFDVDPPTPIQKWLPELDSKLANAINGLLAPNPEDRTATKYILRLIKHADSSGY